MGRHARSYAGEQYTEGLRLKLTPSQKHELEAAATQQDITLSDLCRELLFERLARLVTGSRRNPDAAAVLRTLAPIGNNMNQLAYQANRSEGRDWDSRLLASAIEKFERVCDRILDW